VLKIWKHSVIRGKSRKTSSSESSTSCICSDQSY